MFRTKDFFEAFKFALKGKNYLYLEPMNKGGGFAELFFIYSQEDKLIRIAKVYKEPMGRINEDQYLSDAKKLIKIDHSNVVKIFDKGTIDYANNKYFFLILEYIRGKDLDEIDNRILLEESFQNRLNFILQTLDGINEFRKDFDLHMDLHTGNIMISDMDIIPLKKVKIIDPGSSRYHYEPIEEDIDLYSIKYNVLNSFLQPIELQEIEKKIDLSEIDFPKLRELIKKLLEEERQKEILENSEKDVDTPEFESLINIITKEREKAYDEIYSYDSERKHITFSFSVVPIKFNKKIDFNDVKTIGIIKNIQNDLMYDNPYGRMYDFDKFINNFVYQSDCYVAEYQHNTQGLFNFGKVKIYSNGIITITISIDALPVEAIRSSFLFLENDLLKSLFLSSDLLAYLLIMFLKLIKSIYTKLERVGILRSIISIYSGWDLALCSDKRVLKGTSINPISELDIKISDLQDNEKALSYLMLILRDLLRFFTIDIDRFDEGYELFKEIIDRYFKVVFKEE